MNAPRTLSARERQGAAAALAQRRCFPCGADCVPVGVGLFAHPSSPRSLLYPLCRACARDFADPVQRQAFAEAIHRRFVALGEVKA